MDVGNAVRTASYTMLTVIWNHSESVVVPLCVNVCPIICFRGVKSLETCYFLWEPGSEDMVEGRRREQPLCTDLNPDVKVQPMFIWHSKSEESLQEQSNESVEPKYECIAVMVHIVGQLGTAWGWEKSICYDN